MKRVLCVLVLALALPAGLLAQGSWPALDVIIPEVVWAEAAGGGTWVTELQISSRVYYVEVDAFFFYAPGTSYRHVSSLWISPGTGSSQSVKWPNILAAMQSLDRSFKYFGHSGALWLQTPSEPQVISAVARIYNGNNGKTIPGLEWKDYNTANVGRDMMIMNVMSGPDFRTFAGFFNANGGYKMTCRMSLIDMNGATYGNSWYEAFEPWEFKAFNIFTKAGITSGTHDNLRLLIRPLSSGGESRGLFCFGSIANNTTNDTCTIIAIQYGKVAQY